MVISLLKMFGVSLLLTIVIELAVAKVLGVSFEKKNLQLICLVNCLTNPPAVLFAWMSGEILLQIPIEAVVIGVETWIYRIFTAQPDWNLPKPVRLAVAANGVSWLVGVLFWI